MSDDPRLTTPVLLDTIRAGRRTAHVARLLLGQLEGRDEAATALIGVVDLDLPAIRHRLGETDATPPGAAGQSEKLSRTGVQERLPGFPRECVRLTHGGHPAAQVYRHRPGVIKLVRRPQSPRPVAADPLGRGGVPIPLALPVSGFDDAIDEPGTLRNPKLAARVGPCIDELF
jgi:hypothetical protein